MNRPLYHNDSLCLLKPSVNILKKTLSINLTLTITIHNYLLNKQNSKHLNYTIYLKKKNSCINKMVIIRRKYMHNIKRKKK